eukprot:2513210-Alexandrium_andersonii.AAC.1
MPTFLHSTPTLGRRAGCPACATATLRQMILQSSRAMRTRLPTPRAWRPTLWPCSGGPSPCTGRLGT